jgi:hypothetical protein
LYVNSPIFANIGQGIKKELISKFMPFMVRCKDIMNICCANSKAAKYGILHI